MNWKFIFTLAQRWIHRFFHNISKMNITVKEVMVAAVHFIKLNKAILKISIAHINDLIYIIVIIIIDFSS